MPVNLHWLMPLASVFLLASATAAPPQLGVAVDDAQLNAVSITVFPDGRGLPQGSGNAIAGKPVFLRHCSACHGSNGIGGINDTLTGGQNTLAGPTPKKTVGSFWPYATGVFDYINRAMPYNSPGSLSANELYAVTAYLLAENGVIANDQTMDAQTLAAVEMPNKNGFNWLTTESQ